MGIHFEVFRSVRFRNTILSAWLFGLIVVSIFVLPTVGKVEWGPLWKVKPLLLTPIIIAIVSIILFSNDLLGISDPRVRKLVTVISIIIFLMFSWAGLVLGLAGTMWD